MKSSFLSKYEQKIVKISALTTQGRNPDNFWSYFGRNDDFINSTWNCLTFSNEQQNEIAVSRVHGFSNYYINF